MVLRASHIWPTVGGSPPDPMTSRNYFRQVIHSIIWYRGKWPRCCADEKVRRLTGLYEFKVQRRAVYWALGLRSTTRSMKVCRNFEGTNKKRSTIFIWWDIKACRNIYGDDNTRPVVCAYVISHQLILAKYTCFSYQTIVPISPTTYKLSNEVSQFRLSRNYQGVPQSITVLLSRLVDGNRCARACVRVYIAAVKNLTRVLCLTMNLPSHSAAIQHTSSHVTLTLSSPIPLRPYTLPYWSNTPFLIFDIRALWRSGLSTRAPECQKLKMVG